MPLSKYYGGKGEQVMASMKKTYGSSDKAKKVFYATKNTKDLTGPSDKTKKKHKVK